jgi:hypothetical protein
VEEEAADADHGDEYDKEGLEVPPPAGRPPCELAAGGERGGEEGNIGQRVERLRPERGIRAALA